MRDLAELVSAAKSVNIGLQQHGAAAQTTALATSAMALHAHLFGSLLAEVLCSRPYLLDGASPVEVAHQLQGRRNQCEGGSILNSMAPSRADLVALCGAASNLCIDAVSAEHACQLQGRHGQCE